MTETHVISHRGHHRRVGDEIDDAERRPARGDRMKEFDRDVRGVATRTAVSHRKQPTVA